MKEIKTRIRTVIDSDFIEASCGDGDASITIDPADGDSWPTYGPVELLKFTNDNAQDWADLLAWRAAQQFPKEENR